MATKGKEAVLKKGGKIIRLMDTNLDGSLPVKRALLLIPGSGFMFTNAVAQVSGLGEKTLESLTDQETQQLVSIMENPTKHGIPLWMINRRKDPIKGGDRHLCSSNLDFTKKTDINEMKKLKTYRGIRHSQGLPTRGQRTRGSFRKSGKTIGVKRSKQQPAKAKKK